MGEHTTMALCDAAMWGLTNGDSVARVPEDLREPALRPQTHSPAGRGGGHGGLTGPPPDNAASGDIGTFVCCQLYLLACRR